MIVLLKLNNLSLCLNHEYLKSVLQKYILIQSQKTTYIHAFVGKDFIKFEKMWFYMKYIVKKIQ